MTEIATADRPLAASADAATVAAPPAAPAAAPRPAAASQLSMRKLALPLAAMAGVLVVAAVLLLARSGGKRPVETAAKGPAAAQVPAAVAPAPAAAGAAAGKLEAADRALAAGRPDQAGAVLDAMSPAEAASLSPAQQAHLQELRSSVAGPHGKSVAAQLDDGIAKGEVEQVRSALAAMSKDDRAALQATAKGKEQLALGERAMELDAALVKADREKNYLAAVQHATALLAALPADARAHLARDAAAAAVEAEADTLAKKGQSDAALGRLEALAKAWPDCPGLDARIAQARGDRDVDQRLAASLASADATRAQKRPEVGLEALAKITPPPRWQARFNQERSRLEEQLAELDKLPPVIKLKESGKLEYSKNKSATIELAVTDDHAVKSVSAMARLEGATAWESVPVSDLGSGNFVIQVAPELHKNQPMDLYIVATDYAGHVAQLGTAEKPLKLKKKWSLF